MSTKRGRTARGGAPSKGPDADALEAALLRALPGLEPLERALVLDGRLAADLVLRERGGRLLFLRVAPEGEDEALLAGLELVALAREGARGVLGHLEALGLAPPAGSADPSEPPRAILLLANAVAPSTSWARRLEPLCAAGLECASWLEARGERGASRALLLEPRASQPARPGVDGFLAALAPPRRELALLALRRLERVDEALERRASVEALAFRHEGRGLCELVAEGGELVGRLHDGRRVALRAAPDLDRFLEGVLESLVEGPEPEHASPRTSSPALERLREHELERLREHELVPARPAMLLTPEELEAFRV